MGEFTEMRNMQFKIAIIDSNILACMGLERILEKLIPVAEIVTCESFEELESKDEAEFIHYFVSSRIYFEHTAYFRAKSGRSIVMVGGEMSINGVATLNVCQGEAALVRDLLALQRHGHHENIPLSVGSQGMGHPHTTSSKETLLSTRETEVALLLCQGCINKEVADKLNISITTVITHRKNIMEKLGARSLADVIVYCVMNGIYNV
jgi:DNA-binding CsgD family transcriptional regulator